MSATVSLMDDLEAAVQNGTSERRVETLRRVTDLFLVTPAQLSNEQIGVFDAVLTRLTARVETKARAELARRLAPLDRAPGEVVRQLAHDDEIEVAGPVLSQSPALTTQDLISIARRKGQSHLLAIASRAEVETQVTDVLVDRGNRDVIRRLATNEGAAFSEAGYGEMVKRAEDDEGLIETLGRRADVPPALFRELLSRATEAVRSRLRDSIGADRHDVLGTILSDVSQGLAQEESAQRDIAGAQRRVQQMKAAGRLNESELAQLARQDKYDDAVAALAQLCGTPFDLIDRLLANPRNDALLIPCKAAGLGWITVRVLLEMRGKRHALSEHDVSEIAAEFKKLSPQTAGRVLRFWQVRQTVGAASAQGPVS
jgi:uncharacterized protein (DUF2336 family)